MTTGKLLRVGLLLGIYGMAFNGSLYAQAETNPPPPVPRVYDGINETPWYTNPAVRKHLNLSDDQINRMNHGYSQSWARYNQSANSIGPELTPAQRWQQMHQLHNGFYNNFNQTANDAIPDAAARERYQQLQLQYRGYGAFNDPAVQQQLNLNEAQTNEVIQANRDWHQRMTKWNQDYTRATDQDRVIKQFNESRGDYQEHLKTLLTPTQQRRWESIVGKPYDFPAEAYFDTATTTTTAKPVLK